MLHDTQTSPNSRHVLAAGEVGHVLLIDTASWRTRRLPCDRWDMGGARLAVSDDAHDVYTAAYHVHGLTAWSVADDGLTERWHRRDLKKVQHLTLSTDGRILVASIEGRGTFLLRTSTGTGCGNWRGVTETFAGHDNLFARSGKV